MSQSTSRRNVRHIRGRRAQYAIKLTFFGEGNGPEVSVDRRRSRRSLEDDLNRAVTDLKPLVWGACTKNAKGIVKCILYRQKTLVVLASCKVLYRHTDDLTLMSHELHEILKPSLNTMWIRD